jgi:DNA-binding CsgD family transcriptional regulator
MSRSPPPVKNDSAELATKRQLLAETCRRLLHERAIAEGIPECAGKCGSGVASERKSAVETPTDPGPAVPGIPLSPRVRQTLDRLLQGDSEKQVARRLKLSAHTVHVYVKTLYRKMNVNSRGELLAKFVSPLLVNL